MSDFLEAGQPRGGSSPRSGQALPKPSSSPGKIPPSPISQRALDWFVFFLADVQTGFGAFVSVYLTAQKWTQTDIGLILTVGAIVTLVGQIPGGAIVDAVRSKRWVAAGGVAVVGVSAFALAVSPIFVVVFASRVLQAGASCVLGPSIAAISLGLVGQKRISLRLGRNAAFASIGSGVAAAGMGASAYYISDHAAFILAASMTIPALFALFYIRTEESELPKSDARLARQKHGNVLAGLRRLFEIRPLFIFAGCVALFQLANAAMLPLAASMMTLRSSKFATILVATSIVAPQLIVALFSPWVGRKAEQWGRRPLLVLCFAALAVRGVLFAFLIDPYFLMAAQLLDGVSGAALAVLVPLIVADVSAKTGHFNLAQGVVGCAVGIGASISTTLAGYMSDRFDSQTAFLMMAAFGLVGLAAVCLGMPETRPSADAE
jgi:MFS family permease